MNISSYDFHDGYLIDIQHERDKIILSMESAQISENDLQDDLELSERRTLKGKLHLNSVKLLKIDDQISFVKFEMLKTEGDLFEFVIEGDTVLLTVRWVSDSLLDTDAWYTYEIEAEKIFWENIPDLHNPFW